MKVLADKWIDEAKAKCDCAGELQAIEKKIKEELMSFPKSKENTHYALKDFVMAIAFFAKELAKMNKKIGRDTEQAAKAKHVLDEEDEIDVCENMRETMTDETDRWV